MRNVKCLLKTIALGEKSGIRRLKQGPYIVYRYEYACSRYIIVVLSRSTYLQLMLRGMLAYFPTKRRLSYVSNSYGMA